jgi:hypothetical protein
MKKINANYISLSYNSSIGYSLLIQEISLQSLRVNTRATFSNQEDCAEYLEAKTGKVIARGFTFYFEEIRKIIVSQPDIRTEIFSPFYILEGGKLLVKKT